jgi:hypothetical protein
LEGALGGHLHAAQFAEVAEELEQGAIGQPGREATWGLPDQDAGEVAPQGASAVELLVLLGLGAGLWVLTQPPLQTRFQQLGLQTTLDE